MTAVFDGVLTGNVTSQVKFFLDDNNRPTCFFDVAHNRKTKDPSKKKTQYVQIVSYYALAKICGKYVRQGQRLAIRVSDYHVSPYMGKNGKPYAKLTCLAVDVEFMSGRSTMDGDSSDSSENEYRQQTPYLESDQPPDEGFIPLDSLPFNPIDRRNGRE